MRLLDLFCGAGGAAAGYHLAGFKVTGIDIVKQPNYPYEFIHENALEADLSGYDAIHASPPCQGYCWSTTKPRENGKKYPDLIEPTRERLIDAGVPYVIENVPNAPLRNPTYLEGIMFGLNIIRRRGFETNWWMAQPRFRPRRKPIMQASKIHPGKTLRKSAYCSVAGNGADGWSCRVADWRVAMGISWMTRSEIKEAIPPAYTEYVGRHLLGALKMQQAIQSKSTFKAL